MNLTFKRPWMKKQLSVGIKPSVWSLFPCSYLYKPCDKMFTYWASCSYIDWYADKQMYELFDSYVVTLYCAHFDNINCHRKKILELPLFKWIYAKMLFVNVWLSECECKVWRNTVKSNLFLLGTWWIPKEQTYLHYFKHIFVDN